MSTPPVKARTPTRRRSPPASVAGSESSAATSTDNEKRTPNGYGGPGFGGVGGGGGDNGREQSAVRVVVRVRPQNKKEVEAGGTVCVAFPSEETIEIKDAKKTYDRVFDPEATQQDVFEYVAKPLVGDLFNGYNGTIFAYGQTSSGKTHTMEGPCIHDQELAGVIPRTVREIFFLVAEAPDSLEFVIKVSYIEIYMEKIRDLLDTYRTKMNLPVREDKQRGVYVAGATEEYVTSADELIAVMSSGAKNRVTAATGMNQGSSRSHSVFIISLQQRDVNDSSTKTGMLYLVDLAGSEMVKKTHATGQVLNEAKTINKSLSALGQVINALTDDKKPHVPYRDSKLTRVLQNSLGGNSKTCLIVNCSPSSFNEAETMSTLRFGSRAKRIQNKAVVNETRSVEELGALLSKAESAFDLQQTYIAALENQLRVMKNSGQAPPRPAPSPAEEGGGGEGGDGERASADRARQDDEAANAIRRLTKRNQALQLEIEEEKAEVKRREQVSNELRQVLQEKESLLNEAASLLREAESVHAARQEASSSEKADVEAEVEVMRGHVQEITQRHEFDLEELSLKVEKLSGENSRLTSELREMTGDLPEVTGDPSSRSSSPARPSPSSRGGGATAAAAAAADADADASGKRAGRGSTSDEAATAGTDDEHALQSSDDADNPEMTNAGKAAAAGGGGGGDVGEGGGHAGRAGVGGPGARGGGRASSSSPEGGDVIAAEEMEKFDFAALQSAGAPESAIAIVVEREERWRERDLAMIAEQWKSMNRVQQMSAEKQVLQKQLACNKQNCEQLAQDLENVERRMEQDQGAGDGQGGAELERLKKEKVMLQQRLAQLSEVHRRLLWKFGQVELERAALEKKVRNRDVLIKQLEQDLVTAVQKVKTQKEEHTKKLVGFRNEVSKLEQEVQRQKQVPSLQSQSHLERRAIRGGGGNHHAQEVKTLRGGNGRHSHDDAQPWGGLGFDVKSNTYASAPGSTGDESGGGGAAQASSTRGNGPLENSPGGRPRGEGFLERLLGHRAAGPPKY